MAFVLVVDADPDKSVRLQKALELAGYEVAVASSGTSALTMLRRRRPDLILSQALVEDMYGSELVSDVRGDRTTKEIPFILLVDRVAQMGLAATRSEADMILPENSPVRATKRLGRGSGRGGPRCGSGADAPGLVGGHGPDRGDPGRCHRQKIRAARAVLGGR